MEVAGSAGRGVPSVPYVVGDGPGALRQRAVAASHTRSARIPASTPMTSAPGAEQRGQGGESPGALRRAGAAADLALADHGAHAPLSRIVGAGEGRVGDEGEELRQVFWMRRHSTACGTVAASAAREGCANASRSAAHCRRACRRSVGSPGWARHARSYTPWTAVAQVRSAVSLGCLSTRSWMSRSSCAQQRLMRPSTVVIGGVEVADQHAGEVRPEHGVDHLFAPPAMHEVALALRAEAPPVAVDPVLAQPSLIRVHPRLARIVARISATVAWPAAATRRSAPTMAPWLSSSPCRACKAHWISCTGKRSSARTKVM